MAPRSAAGTGGPSSGLCTERLHRLFLLLLLLLLSVPSHYNPAPAINHPAASQCRHPPLRLLPERARLPGHAAGRGGRGAAMGAGRGGGGEREPGRATPGGLAVDGATKLPRAPGKGGGGGPAQDGQ